MDIRSVRLPGFWIFAFLLWGAVLSMEGQSVISEYKLKDFYVDEEVFPYEWLGREHRAMGMLYEPSVRLSENEFVYLWKPRYMSSTHRRLTCFNLVLEPVWEVEIVLSYEEDIFQVFKSDSQVVVLVHHYNAQAKSHHIKGLAYRSRDGEQVSQNLLMTIPGPSYISMGIDFSPDEKRFMLFAFNEGLPRRQVRTLYDHLRSDQTFGYRITNAGSLHFETFNRSLEKLDEGEVELNLSSKSKRYAFDCQMDNGGNVYVSAYGKNTGLDVFQFSTHDRQTHSLRYAEYPDPWFKNPPYQAHVPPRVGEGMKMYAAHSVREKFHGKWRTRAFRMVTFDFEKEEALLSHEVEIGSAFLVQINKAREEAGRRPDPVFDRYVIQDILPLEDQGLWLVTQRYEEGKSIQDDTNLSFHPIFSSMAEEMILYEFTPEGNARKAIIVPMYQQARSMWGEISRMPHLKVDREEGAIHLVTREYDGERGNKPPRLFYRKIDLEEGTYGPRLQIYDGRQRDQYFVPAFTLWLNPQLLTLLVIDGSGSRNPEVVTIRIEGLKE